MKIDDETTAGAELIEDMAKALAFAQLSNHGSKLRWPSGPLDHFPDADGAVPIEWSFAEKCRVEARAVLAAMPDFLPLTTHESPGLRFHPFRIEFSVPLTNDEVHAIDNYSRMVEIPLMKRIQAVGVEHHTLLAIDDFGYWALFISIHARDASPAVLDQMGAVLRDYLDECLALWQADQQQELPA